ncbi:MAG: glycosyltransferase family A protein [Bacillota bacterium]|nr:glycosyltransferase family A protein [Bacillota bacterium]
MVSVVTCSFREEMIENIVQNFLRQEYEPKELIIVLNRLTDKEPWESQLAGIPTIRVFQLESGTLGECLNLGADMAKYTIIAKFDDDDFYSSTYLSNSIHLFTTTKANVIGKSTIFVYFKRNKTLSLFRLGMENQYVTNIKKNALAGGTLMFKKEILKTVQFAPINLGEDIQFQIDCLRRRIPLYSGSRYDYTMIRFLSEHLHTWQVDDQKFQSHCIKIAETESFETYISSAGPV